MLHRYLIKLRLKLILALIASFNPEELPVVQEELHKMNEDLDRRHQEKRAT